jgi:hypothetical protein
MVIGIVSCSLSCQHVLLVLCGVEAPVFRLLARPFGVFLGALSTHSLFAQDVPYMSSRWFQLRIIAALVAISATLMAVVRGVAVGCCASTPEQWHFAGEVEALLRMSALCRSGKTS